MTTYKVEGCGITILCERLESATMWVREILERGGVPTIKKITEEELKMDSRKGD